MSARIHTALRSGTGCVRTNNEDAWYLNGTYAPLEEMNNEAARQATFPAEGALFAVCDGVGGESNGEIASFTAVDSMKDYQASLTAEGFVEASQAWIHGLNGKVLETSHGGCTLAMICVLGDAVRVGHIGDSRVYRLSQGKLQQITRDHSKVRMLIDAGLITPEQAAVHPQRHVITRSLGMEEDDGVCTVELETPLPFVSGDRYLICSDGVTDMVPDSQLEEMLRVGKTVDDCAEAIYRAALTAGGKDNTTLIVLEADREGGAIVQDDPDATIAPDTAETIPDTQAAPNDSHGKKGLFALFLILTLIVAGFIYWYLTRPGTPTQSNATMAPAVSTEPAEDAVQADATPEATPVTEDPVVTEEPVATEAAPATEEPAPTDAPAEIEPDQAEAADPTAEAYTLPILTIVDVRNNQ